MPTSRRLKLERLYVPADIAAAMIGSGERGVLPLKRVLPNLIRTISFPFELGSLQETQSAERVLDKEIESFLRARPIKVLTLLRA